MFSESDRYCTTAECQVAELRAAASLSHLWQHQGKKKQAWQMLEKIYGWFTEGFKTANLQEARTPLEELRLALSVCLT